MASEQQVREYLAYWFQLGKKIVLGKNQETWLPQPVLNGDRYSQQFEKCWQQILSLESGDCYLEGTDTTITQLLSSDWEIDPCVRCTMPIPLRTRGMPSLSCPCHDLPNWPNMDIPLPRSPVDTKRKLQSICDRLTQTEN